MFQHNELNITIVMENLLVCGDVKDVAMGVSKVGDFFKWTSWPMVDTFK
jgi:hypothetical protein